MDNINLTAKKAYLVTQWGTSIKEGIAFIIIDDYGKKNKTMFSTDNGNSFDAYDNLELFYSEDEAKKALIKEINSYKEHQERKVLEHQNKIAELNLILSNI